MMPIATTNVAHMQGLTLRDYMVSKIKGEIK